jgi:hypothetical protein
MEHQRLTTDEAHRLLDRLAELDQLVRTRGLSELWRIEEEPHDYPDGTTHFTHVRTTGHVMGETVNVTISHRITPALAELIATMRNNLPDMLRLARQPPRMHATC